MGGLTIVLFNGSPLLQFKMKMKKIIAVSLFLFSFTTVVELGKGNTALVEAENKVSKRTKRVASRHFKNGVKLFDKGKHSEALAEFERAYSLAPHPLVLYNLASAHRELSQYDQAVKYFNRFLVDGEGQVSKSKLQAAERELDDIMGLVASVIIESKPDGAKIEIDGRTVGTTPLESPAIVGPGDHIVLATIGSERVEREIRIAAGDSFSVELDFTDIPKTENLATPTSSEDLSAPVPSPAPKAKYPKFIMSGFFAFTLDRFGDTGAPGLGVAYLVHPRFSIGVDGTFVSFSVFPNARLKLFGDTFSVHGVAGVPITFANSESQVAFAGGLGARYALSPSFFFRTEALVSYKDEATFPVSIGLEARF